MSSSSRSTFTPTTFSSDPKQWKGELSLLNPQQTSVVLSLESLILWLKTFQIEVDPNLSQLKQLPKFAQLGRLEALGSDDVQTPRPLLPALANGSDISPLPTSAHTHAARTRTHTPMTIMSASSMVVSTSASSSSRSALLRPAHEIAVAADPSAATGLLLPSSAPSATGAISEPPTSNPHHHHTPTTLINAQGQVKLDERGFPIMVSPLENFIPTRRVRQPIGGGSANIASLFGGGLDEPQVAPQSHPRNVSKSSTIAASFDAQLNQAAALHGDKEGPAGPTSAIPGFVPSRKVRELPGGGSAHISAIFS